MNKSILLSGLLLSIIATILATIALAVSAWSKTSGYFAQYFPPQLNVTNDSFRTGVWGGCMDNEVDTNSNLTIQMHECRKWYSPTTVNRWFVDPGTGSGGIFLTKASECDIFRDYTRRPSTLMPVEYLSDAYRRFLGRTCGSHGKATVSFAALTMSFGLFTSLGFLASLFVTSAFLTLTSLGLALLTTILSLITWILWITQNHPMKRTKSRYSGSFVLSILSMIFFLGATLAALSSFLSQRKNKETDASHVMTPANDHA